MSRRDENIERNTSQISCPSCHSVVSSPGSWCDSCERYSESSDELKSFSGDAFFAQNGDTFSLVDLWQKGRTSRLLLYLFHAVWSVLGALLALDFYGGAAFDFEHRAQLVFVLASFYGAMVLSLNKTSISVNSGEVEVKRGPIPVPTASSFRMRHPEIARVDLFKVRHKSGDGYSIYMLDHKELPHLVISSENFEFARSVYLFLVRYASGDAFGGK